MIRFLAILFIPLFCITIAGCILGGGEVNITTPPEIDKAKRVVVTPFYTDASAAEEVSKLGKRISVNLGERLKLTLKDAEWTYDISNKVKPVDDKLSELGLTLEQVYEDPALAAKLGQALNADLVIIGMVEKPNLKRQDYNRHLMKQGSQSGISGTSTYIRTRLTALGRTRVKVVNANSGELVYNNRVYKTDEERYADLGKYLPLRIAYVLHPTGLRLEEEEQILLEPDIELKGTGGIVEFN